LPFTFAFFLLTRLPLLSRHFFCDTGVTSGANYGRRDDAVSLLRRTNLSVGYYIFLLNEQLFSHFVVYFYVYVLPYNSF